jgi:hypothetical protein
MYLNNPGELNENAIILLNLVTQKIQNHPKLSKTGNYFSWEVESENHWV